MIQALRKRLRATLCWFGVHGPDWHGDFEHKTESVATGLLERKCLHCGTTWHGSQVHLSRWHSYMRWDKTLQREVKG